MATNKKKILLPETLSPSAWALARSRPDVEAVSFNQLISTAEFHSMLGDIDGVALGVTPFGVPELAKAPKISVVARIGVGYDAVDVPALTAKRIPLMIAGIANSPSVAEQAIFFMMALAKRHAELDAQVKTGRWNDRFGTLPLDLFEKTVLIVGFGRIGTRTAKRCLAMDMTVLIYDPYVKPEVIRAAGCEPVSDLDAGLPRADYVSIHCPKNPETIGMFNAARIGRMKPTAFLVNTARGGIVDEPALHAALVGKKIAGAGLDVFDKEPPQPDNPLLKLPNIIAAPHMAGVTKEAMDRMGIATVTNILAVLDGKPNPDNCVNREVLA